MSEILYHLLLVIAAFYTFWGPHKSPVTENRLLAIFMNEYWKMISEQKFYSASGLMKQNRVMKLSGRFSDSHRLSPFWQPHLISESHFSIVGGPIPNAA